MSGIPDAVRPPGITGTADERDQERAERDSPALSAAEAAAVLLDRHRWLLPVRRLALIGLLAGAGAGLRALLVPSAGVAVAGWAVGVAAMTLWWYRPRRAGLAGSGQRERVGWVPGESAPDGVPAVTLGEAGPILARAASRRWTGARLVIAECPGGGRHSMTCESAMAVPAGDQILVVLGVHLAQRPAVAAFTMAHEILHPAGWRCHVSVGAGKARLAGWLAVGWVLGWPWLLAGLVVIQAGYAAVCWVIEIGCDVPAARVQGRDGALEAFAWFAVLDRQARPAAVWKRCAGRLVRVAAGLSPHPPLKVRSAVIRVLVPSSPGGRSWPRLNGRRWPPC